MNKNLNILIIGFGSIGQRHYKNMLSIGFNNIKIFDSDKSRLKGVDSIKNLKYL